jgi:hypothetical protein
MGRPYFFNVCVCKLQIGREFLDDPCTSFSIAKADPRIVAAILLQRREKY